MSRPAPVGVLIGFLISAVFLWYAFRGVNFSAMAGGIARVGVVWVMASILVALTSLVLRGFRWRYLLGEERKIGFWSLVSATFIGVMANNLLPARLGEVVRAWVLAQREQTSTSGVLASVVVERLVDVVTALLLLALSFVVAPTLDNGVAGLLGWSGLAVLVTFVGLAMGLLVVVQHRDRIMTAWDRWARNANRSWALHSAEQGRRFLEGLCVSQTKMQWVTMILLSFLVWGTSIVSFYMMGKGFSLDLTLAQMTLVWGIVLFGVAIPSAPGFVGTFHGFCVAGLALVAGTDPTLAAAYATLLHGSHWLAINGVGLACLLSDRSVTWAGIAGLARQG